MDNFPLDPLEPDETPEWQKFLASVENFARELVRRNDPKLYDADECAKDPILALARSLKDVQ